jgi:putative ABC transport system permease protein
MQSVEKPIRDRQAAAAFRGVTQDVRIGIRQLRATPIVAAVAVLSLALGIGANTALFSLANSLLLRPLPVNEPHRLVMISDTGTPGTRYWEIRVWQQLQRRAGPFEAICSWAATRLTHSEDIEAQPITGGWVSGSYFETLGVRAALGRVLTDADDRPGGGTDGPVMVISDAFWQRRFQRDPGVIGRQFILNGVPVSIVGVTSREFLGTDIGAPFDVLLPIADEPILNRGDSLLNGGVLGVVMFARLKPGQTREAATDALRAMQPEIRESTRPPSASRQAQDPYLRDYMKDPFTVVSAASGISLFRRRYGPPLVALTGAAGLILLIACANIANVLLARANARRHELSVRVALGASRWRLVRQLLVESVLLGSVASTAGLLVATWAGPMLVRQLSTENMPILLDLSADWRLTIFAIVVATTAVLIFGVVPALQASAVAPIDALKEQGRGATGATCGAVPDALVIAQIALSVVLVVAAGLFVRTFASLATRDPGFARDRVLVARLDSRRAIADPMQRIATYERVRSAVRLVPGVADTALSVVTPVSDFAFDPPIDVSGGRTLSLRERQVFGNVISPGWFNTFGVSLIAGRDLTEADRVGTEPVAIVNPAFSHRFLNDANPLDHFITLPDLMVQPARNAPIRIVGVVADAVYGSLREPPQPTMYLPMAQHQSPFFLRNSGTVNLNIRAASESPALLAKSAAATIRSVNPQLGVTFRPLADQLSDSLARERVVATLAGFFGALALLLAGLGLYGVTAYAVARRRAEIGIRMALGATPWNVIRLVMTRVSVVVGVGVVTGAVVSTWASQFVASLLYGLEPYDTITLIGAALALAFVAGVAGGMPAYRASRLDAAEVLRQG